MNFKQLRYFLSVAKSGSISAAAEKNCISQPALGIQIKNLEDHLGMALFQRHARGIVLTDKGIFFLKYAQQILDLVAEAEAEVGKLNGVIGGNLSIAVTPTFGRALVPDLIGEVSSIEAELSLAFVQHFSDEVKEQIDSGRIDIGFSYNFIEDSKYFSAPLLYEDIYLVGHPSILDKFGADIPFNYIPDLPLLLDKKYHANRKWLERIAERQELNLSDAIEIDAVDIKREILLQNESCTVAPYGLYLNLINDGRLTACRIVDPNIVRTLYFVCSHEKMKSPAVQWFYETTKKLVDEKIEEGKLQWQKENYDRA